jgi:Domain of unknown function (DUF4126)
LTNTLTGVLLAAAAGLNAFLPLLGLGLVDRFSSLIDLEQPYDVTSSPWGIALMLLLATADLVLDKIPRVDHLNDLLNSAIRPAAGMFLIMAVTNGKREIDEVVAMLLGLLIAGAVHVIKAVSRTRITIATNGLANPLVSLVEDGVAGIVTLFALTLPWLGLAFAVPGGVLLGWLYLAAPGSRVFSSPRSNQTRTSSVPQVAHPLAVQGSTSSAESARAKD